MHPKRISFNGYEFRLSGNYYRRNVWGSDGPSNLHRAIWEFYVGEIPKGFHIHHLDGNPLNNALDNLWPVEGRQHQREHTLERIRDGDLLPPGDAARAKAAEWHGSGEGKRWHSEHSLRSWKTRESKTYPCQNCGKEFESTAPRGGKYCSPRCKLDAKTKANGGIPRSERKPVRCVCEECGQSFMSTIPERVKYCHTNCKTQAHRRKRGETVGVRPYRQKARVLPSERATGQ